MTPSPFAPDPNKLKASFGQFCSTVIRPTVDTDKAIWNARVRQNYLYYRGDQHLGYGNSGVPGFADYVAVGNSSQLGVLNRSNANLEEVYDYVLNVFQGDVDTFTAVLGSRAPNCQAQARDRGNELEVRLKSKADRVNAWLDSGWKINLLHGRLVRGLALYGTMFSYTRFRIDGRAYGLSHQQNYQTQLAPLGDVMYHCMYCGQVTPATQAQAMAAQTPGLPPDTVPCSKCGNPLGPSSLVQPDMIETLVPSGTTPYANGAVECNIYNPAHFTVDLSKSDLSEAPWGILELEVDKGSLVLAYPELREKVYQEQYNIDDIAKGSMGKWTRALLTSPSGYTVNPRKGQWLLSLVWLTPAAYEYIPGDKSGQVRDYMHETYPDGVRVPMVNGELLVGNNSKQYKDIDGQMKPYPNRMVNERMTSVIACCKPKHSETIYADPYFECMIQAADVINDSVNIVVESGERSNPLTIADPEIMDPEWVRWNRNNPGLFYFAKANSGGFDKSFFKLNVATVSGDLISFIDKYLSWTREITGIVPALFGGMSGGSDQTAYEADLKHNQAMMKLSPTWENIRQFWAQTKENGINQAAKYSDGKLYSNDQHGNVQSTEIPDIYDLCQGGWYMECEESMPMSIGQRRNWVMSILKLDPQLQANVFGVNEPENVMIIQESIGVADWTVPGYDQIQRLHDVISQLSQGQPIQQPPPPPPTDPMTGMVLGPPPPPPPPQPSIPFDGFLFDAAFAVKVLKGWLRSDRGAQMQGTPGYDNVMAYAHQAQSTVPPPPSPDKMLSISANLQDMQPGAQAAIMQHEGIQVPPGAPVMLPPPPPKPLAPPLAPPKVGAESHPSAGGPPHLMPPHEPQLQGALQ